MIKLNSKNYSVWKTLMENMIHSKDFYGPVEGEKVKPTDKSDAEWKRMNRKAIA